MKIIHQLILTFAVTLCFSSSSFAHYIWIEVPNTAEVGSEQIIKIYYGEFNEGLREIKGGRLEEVDGIVCWVITPDGKKLDLKVTMQEKYYQVKFTPEIDGNYTIIATNKVREVIDWSKYDIGIVRPVYYTSKQITVGKSNSVNLSSDNLYPELVIVPYQPDDKNRKQPSFQLLYNNKPFVNTKLFVHAANEWSKEYKTNDEGVFTFNPLWKGQYVIECIYKEKNPGAFKGKNYEAIRHRATYTYKIDE